MDNDINENNGDWGLGIGDWGLGNPQSPIPNPHLFMKKIVNKYIYITIL